MSPEQPSSKIGKSVGEKLRAARIAQHFTQNQLAAPDFSVSYISAIERGQIHPSLRALEILAGRLGLTSTQLLPHRTPQEEHLDTTTSLIEQDKELLTYTLLEIHLSIMDGHATEALNHLETLNTHTLTRDYQLQQRYLQGLAHYRLHQYQEADFVLTEAEQIAIELHAHSQQVQILSLQASTYSAMRNKAQALQAFQRCQALLEDDTNHHPFFLLQLYLSLGQHYIRFDNTATAIDTFSQALAIADTLTTPANIQDAYVRQSLSDKAYESIRLYTYKSRWTHHFSSMKYLHSELYHYLGHALFQQHPQTACSIIDELLQNATLANNPLAQASLFARKTEWYLTQNQLADASTCAQQTQKLAQPVGDTIMLAEAYILLGRIEFAQQNYPTGKVHFTNGLDMLERLESHEELANESARYAQLLEGMGSEREAFIYFRRAFQSRQKLGR